MTADEFAACARAAASKSALAQGFSETVTDPEALRLLRGLLRGGDHAPSN